VGEKRLEGGIGSLVSAILRLFGIFGDNLFRTIRGVHAIFILIG
jgi:hypothetical protein